MPAYNGEQHIQEAIASLRAQTYDRWELIVIDDGSRDGTAEIVAHLCLEDRRIRLFRQENTGQGGARGSGLLHSQAPLVGFLDQDDLWEPNKLELQVPLFETTGADVVFSNGTLFGERPPRPDFVALEGRFQGPPLHALLFSRNQIPILSALVRRDFVVTAGGVADGREYQHCDDYELWLRLADAGAIFIGMPERLVRYRFHSGQASKDLVAMAKAEIAVINRHGRCPGVTAELRLRRHRELYTRLVEEAFASGDVAEVCAALMRCSADTAGWVPLPQWERTILRSVPWLYPTVRPIVRRSVASVSYRVVRPLGRALRRRHY